MNWGLDGLDGTNLTFFRFKNAISRYPPFLESTVVNDPMVECSRCKTYSIYTYVYIHIYIHTVDEESILGEMIGKHSHIKLKSSHMWGYLPLLFVQRI